jgi:dephospho-CoA kinase
MTTVLVTGPIGSGKSEVCRYLADKGYPVYDCDSRTKALYDTVPGLREKIEAALEIEWKDIGVIFTDTHRRLQLESIVYPLVVEDILKWKASLEGELAFIESAIALDKRQFDSLYDKVLMVTAPEELRVGRNPHAALRGALQSFDPERISYTIENDSTIEELHLKTDKLLCRLI